MEDERGEGRLLCSKAGTSFNLLAILALRHV